MMPITGSRQGFSTSNMEKVACHVGWRSLKFETIDETQIKDIMAGREPRPPADWDDTPATPGATPREREATDGTIGKPASQH